MHIGEGGEATKRRAARAELLAEVPDPRRAAAVLAAFTMEDTRLITVERDSVEIIHETLLHAWPQLRAWIDENTTRLRTEQQLTEAAHAWDKADRDPALLYTGNRLAHAEAWAADESADGGNPLALEFVRAGGRRRRHAATRRRSVLGAVLCVLVVIAAVLATLLQSTNEQRRRAQTQHRTATARGLVFQAESLRETAPDTAVRLGMAAQRLGSGDAARASLMTTLLGRHEPDFLTAHTGPVKAVACSDDGRTMATAGADRTILLWDLTDRSAPRRIARLTGHHKPVRAVAFARGGTLLATGGEDRTIILWDLSDTSRPRRLSTLDGATSTVESVAFSPDRRSLLSGGAGRFGILWDIAKPTRPRKLTTLEGGTYKQVHGVAFTPDGRTAVVDGAGESPYIWDVSDRDQPRRLGFAPGRGAEEVYAVAIAPDGRTLAVAYSGNEVILWDIPQLTTTDNQRQLSVVRGHTRPVRSLAFSPDGRTLATASEDHQAQLWNVTDTAHPRRMAVLNGHSSGVSSVAFAADGRTVITGSDDHRVALWDAAEQALPHPTTALPDAGGQLLGLALPPGGPTLAATTDTAGERVTLWELTSPRHPRRLSTVPATDPTSVSFSPDGRLMAVLGTETTHVQVYDLGDPVHPRHASTLTSNRGWISSTVFSPDGRTLATVTEGPFDSEGFFDSDAAVTIFWDVARPARPHRASAIPAGMGAYVVFSPDRRTLISSAYGEPAVLWDVSTSTQPRRLARIAASGDVFSNNPTAAFTPDGKTLALARDDRQATVLYDIRRPTRPSELATLIGHSASPQAVAFGARGRMLATADDDGTLILWDVTVPATPRRLTVVSGSADDSFGSLVFSPDTTTLVSGHPDIQHGVLWDVTEITQAVTDPVARACSLVDRGLTPDEWRRATEGLPFQSTCPPPGSR